MRYFLDTEFSERGRLHPLELISIGIVAEDGRTFYAHHAGYDADACNDWVKANVLPHVANDPRQSTEQIVRGVLELVGDDTPEFWGYFADYDWVVVCQLFGTMMDLPAGWPMYCHDIKQLCDQRGNPPLPAQSTTEHDALNDALWNKLAYESLNHAKETDHAAE